MAPSGVVSHLPLGVHDWPLPDLHNAVARTKTHRCRRPYEVNMCPLKPVVVHVVRDLAKQDSLRFEHPIGFLHKGRICVSEIVAVLSRGLQLQTKPNVKVLRSVQALIRYVGRVVYNHIERGAPERKTPAVSYDIGSIRRVYIQTYHRSSAVPPEPSLIDSGIQDQARRFSRIEVQHPCQKFVVLSLPDRRKRVIPDSILWLSAAFISLKKTDGRSSVSSECPRWTKHLLSTTYPPSQRAYGGFFSVSPLLYTQPCKRQEAWNVPNTSCTRRSGTGSSPPGR